MPSCVYGLALVNQSSLYVNVYIVMYFKVLPISYS